MERTAQLLRHDPRQRTKTLNPGGPRMKMEQYIRAIAGTFILISVGLGWFYHKYWFLFTAFVGLNLLQSAFTKWCLMEDILSKIGIAKKPCCENNPSETKY
jgi:hypothetical protein